MVLELLDLAQCIATHWQHTLFMYKILQGCILDFFYH